MKKHLIILIISAFFLSSVPVVRAVDYTIPTVNKFRVGKQYNKKIQLRWKKIKNTKNYKVKFYQIKTLRQKSNGKYKKVKQNRTNKNYKKKQIKKLSSGRAYLFKIRACRTKKRCGPWSELLTSNTTTPDPVLKNLIIDIEPYNSGTGMAGGFNFTDSYNEEKVFLEFGAEVDDGAGGTKILPTFEYRTDPDAQVYSPVKGEITMLDFQDDTQDYELSIGQSSFDTVGVWIDHVKNIQVAEGDSVKAGDLLGTAGNWSATVGRVELMLTNTVGYPCPFNYFDEDLKTEYENKITQLMNDWETFKYDDTIYDEDSMTYAAGCPYDFLTNDDL